MAAKLRLYIWDDFMSDYNAGLAVAIAPDIRSARRAVAEASGWKLSDPYLKRELAKKPGVIPVTEGMAAQAWERCGASA